MTAKPGGVRCKRSVWVVEFRCAKDEPWLRSDIVPRACLTKEYATLMMRTASQGEEKYRRVTRYEAVR